MDVNAAAPILAIILLIFALALFVVGIKDITDWSRAKRRNPSSEDTPQTASKPLASFSMNHHKERMPL